MQLLYPFSLWLSVALSDCDDVPAADVPDLVENFEEAAK